MNSFLKKIIKNIDVRTIAKSGKKGPVNKRIGIIGKNIFKNLSFKKFFLFIF